MSSSERNTRLACRFRSEETPKTAWAGRVFHRESSLMWYSSACDAIDQGKCLKLEYENFARIVEVHRVGVSPEGHHIMSGWQIQGPQNERVGWKLLRLGEPISLTLTAIPSLAPRPDYRRGVKQFIGIVCQL